MLFGYPVAATSGNWLHECLSSILNACHACWDNGQKPPNWPDIIPVEHRPVLAGKDGLESRLINYIRVVSRLSSSDRSHIINALESQNNIAGLLECESNCPKLSELPEEARNVISDLFGFAYKLLTDLGIRDDHYKIIYEADSKHICPFCGCEFFDAPGAPREDLDHFLAKSIYPFSAANLVNLVPMGGRCNQKYKKTQDVLYNDDGARRRSYFPYSNQRTTVSLRGSAPFEGEDGVRPDWRIDFFPSTEASETWDAVFSIRTRYKRDVLDPMFLEWLRTFQRWCFHNKISGSSDDLLLSALDRYVTLLNIMEPSGRDFLQPLVFEMLYEECERGNERLIDYFYGLIFSSERNKSI